MEFEQNIIFPFEDIRKGSRIVLYGAGDVGQAFYHQIKRKDYCSLVGWLDQRWEKSEELETPFIRSKDLEEVAYDTLVIAVSNAKTAETIRQNLIELGVDRQKIYFPEKALLRYPKEKVLPKKREKKATEAGKRSRKQLKIGILAVSSIAVTLAGTIREKVPNAKVVSVASRTLKKAQEFAERFQIEKSYGSYEELLTDDEVDLVYISSPTAFHYEHTMLCLRYGKHVLCEKPFAMNAEQAEKMLQYAKEKKLFLSDGLWTSFLPMAEIISEIVRSGRIGRISTVCANQHYYAKQGTRLRNVSLGGSAVMEMGVYLITLAEAVFGEPIQEIKTLGEMDQDGVDEQVAVILKYETGLAVLSCGMNAVSDRMGAVYGSKGFIIIQDANEYKRIQLYGEDGTLLEEINSASGYEYEINSCVQAIFEGRTETEARSHNKIFSCMQILDKIRGQLTTEKVIVQE